MVEPPNGMQELRSSHRPCRNVRDGSLIGVDASGLDNTDATEV
jgi:hypothetical protein